MLFPRAHIFCSVFSIIVITFASKLDAANSPNCVPTDMSGSACEHRRSLRKTLENPLIKKKSKKLPAQQERKLEIETREVQEHQPSQSARRTFQQLRRQKKKSNNRIQRRQQHKVRDGNLTREDVEQDKKVSLASGDSLTTNHFVKTHQPVKRKIERRIPQNVTAICRAAHVRCASDELCVVNIQNLPVCRCISVASCGRVRPRSFVCATDGKTYLSRCHLTATSCAMKMHSPFSLDSKLLLHHRGECAPGQGAILLRKQLQLRIRAKSGTREQRRRLRALRRAEEVERRQRERRLLKKRPSTAKEAGTIDN